MFPGTDRPHFHTPAVYCPASETFAAVVSKLADSAPATASSSGVGSSDQTSEVWLWAKQSAGTSLIRNAKRKLLPLGVVHSIHPVGAASTFVDPGPVEFERRRGLAANSLAKVSGFSVSEPPADTAADNAPASSNVIANATFAVVFADGSVAHVTLANGEHIPSFVRLSAPETKGSPAVLAAAHGLQSFVTVAAAAPSTGGASVSLFTSQVHTAIADHFLLIPGLLITNLVDSSPGQTSEAESLMNSNIRQTYSISKYALYSPN